MWKGWTTMIHAKKEERSMCFWPFSSYNTWLSPPDPMHCPYPHPVGDAGRWISLDHRSDTHDSETYKSKYEIILHMVLSFKDKMSEYTVWRQDETVHGTLSKRGNESIYSTLSSKDELKTYTALSQRVHSGPKQYSTLSPWFPSTVCTVKGNGVAKGWSLPRV